MRNNIDTVVVPAREDTFQKIWIGQNCWYAIPMAADIQPLIKYIAIYQVHPYSAITYIASVASIDPWPNDPKKVVIKFAEPAKKIGPIPLVRKSRVKPLYGSRYTNYEKLIQAQSLDDIW